jgi:hypothetical protein
MDFKKVSISKNVLNKIVGGANGDDPCCSVTIYANGKPPRTDDEDCDDEKTPSPGTTTSK